MTLSKAVVLAAGLGARLRPITDHIPKPLLPLANRSALSRLTDKLKSIGITSLFINTHHLAEQIEREAAKLSSISVNIVREIHIRGTGGGVENFRADLNNSEFLIHNCDVYSDQDLNQLIYFHRQRKSLVTLMGVDCPPLNTLRVEDNHLTGISNEPADLTYAGIAVVSPDVWRFMPTVDNFALTDVLLSAIASGEEVAVFRSEAYWSDFGAPSQYLSLHRHLAECEFPQIDPTASVKNCVIKGFAFIGSGCRVEDCEIEDSVLLPGTEVRGEIIKRFIVGKNIKVQADRLV